MRKFSPLVFPLQFSGTYHSASREGNSSQSDPTTVDPAEISFFESLQSLLASSLRIDTRGVSEPTDPRQQFYSEELQRRSIGDPREIRTICGADAFYYHDGNRVLATASLLLANGASVLETRAYRGRFTFPYVSGIFFLHEGPFVVAAVRALSERPDLVCFDAHGMSHPRRLGLATICGMVLGIPSLGCAKSRLVGETRTYKDGLEKIVFDGMAVGFVTRFEGVRRYWSPGFSMSMDELEGIIREHSEACIKSIAEADQVGRSSSYDGSKK